MTKNTAYLITLTWLLSEAANVDAAIRGPGGVSWWFLAPSIAVGVLLGWVTGTAWGHRWVRGRWARVDA